MSSLLIIGAGGHGKVVADIAEQCGYENIAFLDDASSEAIGKISELDKYMPDYDKCFVAIGNNVVRNNLIAIVKNLNIQSEFRSLKEFKKSDLEKCDSLFLIRPNNIMSMEIGKLAKKNGKCT